MRRFICALLGASALSFLAPAFAHAAAFFIDDTRADDNILFSANDFENGITINGLLLQQGLSNPGSLLLPEADATGNAMRFDFSGTWQIRNATLPNPVQVAFLEPGTQAISDILFAQYTPQQGGFLGNITGFFISDAGEKGLDPALFVPGVPVTNWPEQNGAVGFGAAFLTASANSDVEVPEPSSIVILGVLGGALVLMRRRLSV
jgi:hypothetical protein